MSNISKNFLIKIQRAVNDVCGGKYYKKLCDESGRPKNSHRFESRLLTGKVMIGFLKFQDPTLHDPCEKSPLPGGSVHIFDDDSFKVNREIPDYDDSRVEIYYFKGKNIYFTNNISD